MKQYISFGPSAGICNRIKRLFSALRFNVNWDEPLDFYWSQGELTNHSFSELFTFDLFAFNEIYCDTKVLMDDAKDVAADIGWRLKIKEHEVPEGFTQAFRKDKENEEYIDFEYERIPSDIKKIYMNYFDALRPSKNVQKRIESVKMPENCVSVHVRQGRYWNEFSRGTKDSICSFIDVMSTYPNNVNFFLAAADETTSEVLKEEFSGRIVELPEKSFTDSIDAVAELYLLGMTNELIATYGSTFSEVAWWLGGGHQKVKIIGNVEEWKVKCPVCKQDSQVIMDYSRGRCMDMYRHLYREVPENLEICDYLIRKCNHCGLVFADPMKGGSQSFYSWVTSHDNYYPTKEHPRWEWGEICSYLKNHHVTSLLEVGCGTGEFLDFLREELNIRITGLDTTTISCQKAEEKGLNVYNIPLEKYVLEHKEKYDCVTAFHLLEHVEDPLGLLKDMMRLLKPNGLCILSFPYSDNRLNQCFTTANNMPPHHVTRWEYSSIKALADAVDASFELVGPKANTIKADVVSDLKNEFFPVYNNAEVSDMKLFIKSARNWRRSKNIIISQRSKEDICISEHIGEEPVMRRPPWFVMVVFRKK